VELHWFNMACWFNISLMLCDKHLCCRL
jgi:hypothetical protein